MVLVLLVVLDSFAFFGDGWVRASVSNAVSRNEGSVSYLPQLTSPSKPSSDHSLPQDVQYIPLPLHGL